MIRILILAVVSTVCVAGALERDAATAARLNECAKLYEGGEYVKSVDCLVDIFPLLPERYELAGYKYLAYSYTMLQMTERAASTFAAALGRYPHMQIDTLEAPPAILSLFREVQLKVKLESRAESPNDAAIRIALGSILAIVASGGLFAGGVLIGVSDGDSFAIVGGAAVGAVSAALIPISLTLISKNSAGQRRTALRIDSPLRERFALAAIK